MVTVHNAGSIPPWDLCCISYSSFFLSLFSSFPVFLHVVICPIKEIMPQTNTKKHLNFSQICPNKFGFNLNFCTFIQIYFHFHLLSSILPLAVCPPFPSFMRTPPSFFLACLPSLLRKSINLQAEQRACVLFLFIRGSGHMSVSLCLSSGLDQSVCLCVCLCSFIFVFLHLQVNTRPNPANDCTQAVPDSMANNR